MPKCVICGKEVSAGSFNMKDKYELAGNSFICKECAEKMGIRNFFSAGMMNAEKAKQKYFEMYPEELNKRRGKENVDDDHIVSLMFAGKKLEAMRYVQEVAGIGSNAASRYIEKVYFTAKVNQHPTNEVEAMVVAMNNSDLSKGAGRSVADELTKLKALLDQGVLTQEEFEDQKKKLLGHTDTPAIPEQPKFDYQQQINPPDPPSKTSVPTKKKKKLHIFSWIGIAFFGLLGLVFFPSAVSVVALLMVVYLCPVNAIRSRRDKWIPNTLLRVLLGCLLFIALIIATPTNSSESGSEAEASAAPKNSTVETAAASIQKSNAVKPTAATVPKNTVAETVPTTAATEPPSPYESVFYIDFVNNISDYDGKKVEITVPVDSIYSDGDISVKTSSKINKRISIESGHKEYYDKKDSIKYVTVRGIAKNNSSDIEIRKPDVIYAGPEAPDTYKRSVEEYEALIVQGKLAVRDEFIRNASSVSFESLRRNPDTYEGKSLKMTIQVSKVETDGVIFNGAVWATYEGHRVIVYDHRENREPRLMAGDTITIYAEGNGLSKIKTYEKGTGLFGTDLGANVVNEENDSLFQPCRTGEAGRKIPGCRICSDDSR